MNCFLNQAIVALFLLLTTHSVEARPSEEGVVNWLTIEEAETLMKQEARVIMVSVSTDWCGWCRRMYAETFSHPVIAKYLNDNYYPVKLNAEQLEPIVFQGVEYVNSNPDNRRPTHDFAIALLQGKMSYPSLVFFNDQMQLLTAVPGFRPAENMEAVLVFFYEQVYLENPDLDSYMENFEGSIHVDDCCGS